MKNLLVIIFLLFISNSTHPQQQRMQDSLRAIINKHAGDTNEVNALAFLANQHSSFDSTITFAQRGIILAQKLKYKMGEADCYIVSALAKYSKDISEEIQDARNALNIYKELNDNPGIITAHGILQASYREMGDYKNALLHAFEGEQIAQAKDVKGGKFFLAGRNVVPAFFAEISQTYLLMNQLDSASCTLKRY